MIYFLITEDKLFVKIGFTNERNKRRVNNYNTHSPYDLELALFIPGERSDEKAIHSRFKEFLKRNEWFYMASEIYSYIEENKRNSIYFVSRQKVNEQLIKEISQCYSKGMPVVEISVKFQRTTKAIRKIVERNKIKRTNWYKSFKVGET